MIKILYVHTQYDGFVLDNSLSALYSKLCMLNVIKHGMNIMNLLFFSRILMTRLFYL